MQIKVKNAKPTKFWTKEIKEAKARKRANKIPFSETVIDKAEDWPDCACGNQDRRIPRSYGEPLDRKLSDLGVKFGDAVRHQNPSKAEKLMKQIEKRSSEILYAIEAKENFEKACKLMRVDVDDFSESLW